MAEHTRVHGVHAVRWLLKEHPERVRQLWLQSTRDDARTEELAALARSAGISVQRVDARKLDEWTEGASHQGVVADAEPSRGWSDRCSNCGEWCSPILPASGARASTAICR